MSSMEPLISANRAVTVLRSPSSVAEASVCPGVMRIWGAVGATRGEPAAADAASPASEAPQSSQNADEGAFSAPHFGHRLDSGLPHVAQNFLPVELSFPHLEQRIALPSVMRPTPISTAFRTVRSSGLAQIAFAQILEIVLYIQLLAGGSDQQVVEGQQRAFALHVFA